LLFVRSPQEQHYYNQQGNSIILCHSFLTKYKNTLNYTYHVTSVYVFHIPQNIKLQLILNVCKNTRTSASKHFP
jgi:hypothetical protein